MEINTVLLAENQAVLVDTEKDLQRAIFQLTITSEVYNMKISSEKPKTMTFKGKEDAMRNKIVTNGNIIAQVNTFKYLGNEILHQKEVDVSSKIANFLESLD